MPIFWTAFVCFACCFLSCHAEIQKVTLTWNNIQCNESCGRVLNDWFTSLKKTSHLKLDWRNGRAELFWKPNERFDYEPLRAVMARMGLHINKTEVLLRGTISHDGSGHVFIHSLGDNTSFELLSEPESSKTLYVERYSIFNLRLREDLRQAFLTAENNGFTVQIDGHLYDPLHRPLKLIVDQSRVDQIK